MSARFATPRIVWLLGMVVSLTAAAQEAGPDLTQLMAAFARMPGLEASFVEEKHLGLLAQPLTSKGRLFFARPGLMLRRVESPARSEVVITPQALKLRDENGEQKLDLAARPDVRPFVESLAWLLAGDHKALATVYRIEFVPSRERDPWRLTLTPKGMPLSHLIAAIEVQGTGYAVSEIHVRERSGDETITRITQANPARRFTPAELSSLFGVTPQGKR